MPPQVSDPRKAEIIAAYNREHDALVSLIRRVEPRAWDRPSPCPGWSAKDLLGHVSGAATMIGTYVQLMLEGKRPNPTRADLDAGNEARVRERRGRLVPELVQEIEVSHQKNIDLLLSLTDEQLAVEGALSSGEAIQVIDRFRRAGRHYREHGRQIAQAAGLGEDY